MQEHVHLLIYLKSVLKTTNLNIVKSQVKMSHYYILYNPSHISQIWNVEISYYSYYCTHFLSQSMKSYIQVVKGL
jgi:hypothetical protein